MMPLTMINTYRFWRPSATSQNTTSLLNICFPDEPGLDIPTGFLLHFYQRKLLGISGMGFCGPGALPVTQPIVNPLLMERTSVVPAHHMPVPAYVGRL